MFYAIYMATRPRARACIFHKTLGVMLHTAVTVQTVNIRHKREYACTLL